MEKPKIIKIKTKKGDVIEINPEKNSKQVTEAVLTLAQRRKRALALKKRQSRIQLQRQLALKRFASDLSLKRRSRNVAREILRARIAGQKGVSYKKLSPAEKIMVDKMIQGREKTLTTLTKRVSQRVRRSEAERVTRVRANLPIKRQKRSIMAEYEPSQINKLFELKLAKRKNTATLYQAGKQDMTPGKISTATEKRYAAVDEGVSFEIYEKLFNFLSEDAQVKAHLRAATLSQMRGQYKRASIHRKIASALTRKDFTTARALMSELRTVNENADI